MKVIGAVTIGKLIEAHYEKDEHKFKSYAEFIADAYNEMGEERAERIIRSRIDGSYKDKPKVIIPEQEIKENAELKKDKEWLDNTNNEQTRVILELQEHIIKVENDSNNCEHWSYTRIKQLEAQIERMKCCGNCKHREDCVYEHAWDLCDEWEFAE